MTTMRAVIQRAYGGPDVLKIEARPVPVPAAGEVLIRIRASDVTSGDARMRAFRVPGIFWLPGRLSLGVFGPRNQTPGVDFAGEVTAIGSGVTRYRVGDRVFGQHGFFGSHADYRVVPETAAIAAIPAGLSFEEAAALPFGGFTVLDFFARGGYRRGESLLVNGASGAVGVAAVQIGKAYGSPVTAVCSGRNAEAMRALGADAVLDYRAPGFAVPTGAFDVVFDTVGSFRWADVAGALKPGGRFFQLLISGGLLFDALRRGKHMVIGTGTPTAEGAAELARLAASGALRPVIDSRFDFTEIAEAHRRVDTGRKVGAVVLTM